MFILKGRFLEKTHFTNKNNQIVEQAVIYSEGDGTTFKISGVNCNSFKPYDPVEIPVSVGVYDGRLFLKLVNSK